tara:strand:+ start:570 stop:833 length:264 start_codon:yes stop_codon:yes gene_type:complete
MNIEKIYKRSFDNPLNEDGTRKESELLGEFEIIETLNEDHYTSQRLGVLIGSSKVYLIDEYEVTGLNGGSRFEVTELKSLTVRFLKA